MSSSGSSGTGLGRPPKAHKTDSGCATATPRPSGSAAGCRVQLHPTPPSISPDERQDTFDDLDVVRFGLTVGGRPVPQRRSGIAAAALLLGDARVVDQIQEKAPAAAAAGHALLWARRSGAVTNRCQGGWDTEEDEPPAAGPRRASCTAESPTLPDPATSVPAASGAAFSMSPASASHSRHAVAHQAAVGDWAGATGSPTAQLISFHKKRSSAKTTSRGELHLSLPADMQVAGHTQSVTMLTTLVDALPSQSAPSAPAFHVEATPVLAPTAGTGQGTGGSIRTPALCAAALACELSPGGFQCKAVGAGKALQGLALCSTPESPTVHTGTAVKQRPGHWARRQSALWGRAAGAAVTPTGLEVTPPGSTA
ncbi:hypothetical protein V8C86DRAFT_3139967 [Haematococcus lacustris]